MASPDISNEIPFDIGQPTLPTNIYYNTGIQYDVAVGGLPFILATSDQRPYERVTAPYRKQQFDNSSEPGEQSLTGWWIRSQSSFHRGAGIKYYDPSAGEEVLYRFSDSRNVDVWTPGEVKLLPQLTYDPVMGHFTTNGRQFLRTIKDGDKDAVLMLDGHDIDKLYLDPANPVEHFVDYIDGTDKPVFAFCDDGQFAFWVTEILDSGAPKLVMYKKLLTDDSGDPNTEMFKTNSILPADGRTVMEFVKNRIILANKNIIYELTPTSTSLPSPLYTHPTTTWSFTAIAESGSAIYVAGYSGTQSNIIKFSLSGTGTLPTLAGGNVVAEMPPGERITAMRGYLGFLLIGTTRGVRVAQIDQNGDLVYGPLVFESSQPVYEFACRDRFAWCAAGVDGNIGLRRIDLSVQIAPLQFAWANDMSSDVNLGTTTAVAFAGETDRLIVTMAATRKTGTITSVSATGTEVTYTVDNDFMMGEKITVTGMVPVGYNTAGATVISSDGASFTIANTTTGAVTTYGTAAKTGEIFIQSDGTVLASTGYITTGRIRYGTLEPKHFKRIDIRADFPAISNTGNAGIEVSVIDEDGSEFSLINYTPAIGTPEVNISSIDSSREFLSFKFTLTPGLFGPVNISPLFNAYQVKSLPASPRQHLIQVPVYVYDVERDRFNNETGYFGRAHERLLALEELDATGNEVTFQDFTTGEQFTCVIEEFSFRGQTPPDKRFSGFGGFANIIVRKL